MLDDGLGRAEKAMAHEMHPAANPPGLDVAALDAWLRHHQPELVTSSPLSARIISGGRSNLTYSIRDASRPLVLRRPPLGHVQRTAHDMAREFRVIAALHGSSVPVPRPVRFIDDASAGVDAPFYLMQQVPGRILRQRSDNARYSATQLDRLSRELIGSLAALHSTDAASVGLADFGRPEGFLPRQLDRWARQYDGSRNRDLRELDALQSELQTGVPDSTRAAIVHGDFRLDNALVTDAPARTDAPAATSTPADPGTDASTAASPDAAAPTISAILDWEMSTLGDPLTDLGLFGLYWRIGELDAGPEAVPSSVSTEDGYPTFDELVAVYADATGSAVHDLPWYLAFAAYKLAVILEGIHFRYQAGQTVGDGFESIGALVTPLAVAGRNYLKGA